ncbi:SDR family oxidoreductase [Cryobacterium tagatosivorans]|uniref:SDR family oxidoreductase n=1 Tax=Cryobacterium tagatosivorans TaxID=1259199 RepID=A0A4R8UHT5_9MICO|nr:SDR family oxidoreductase [Cryobacterium tagatosivorans]
MAGKRVMVAGGGGLGAALCAAFADVGASVFVVDRDPDVLATALDSCPDGVLGQTADVGTKAGADAAVVSAVAALGGLDVLVHAVGINLRQAIVDIDVESWQLTQDVNTASFLWLAKAAKTELEGGGRVVTISSVSGTLAHPDHGSYAASKGALNQLVRVMAVEWAASGIAINAVAPAYTITPLTEAYVARPGRLEALVKRVPAGRLGLPEDVVGPVLLLASSRAEFVTGQVINVDGGRTLD